MKGFFLTISILLIQLTAPAQNSFGIKAGANFSTITHTKLGHPIKSPIAGPSIGVIYSRRWGRKLPHVVQFELLFSGKGNAYRQRNADLKEKFKLHTYYLDIPVYVKAYLGKKKIKGIIGGGLQLSIGMFQSEKTKIKFEETNIIKSRDPFSSEFKRVDFSIPIVTGFQFRLNSVGLLEFNLSNSIGLIPILKNDYNSSKKRNLVVQFTTAFIFDKKITGALITPIF